MKQSLCTIINNIEIMPGVHLISFESPYIAAIAQPGQFITIGCNDVLLRRPFSIHKANSGQVSILFQTVGKGTAWLSKQKKGNKLNILGPLGRAFNVNTKSKHLLLIGGGIGIAPLIFLIQRTLPEHLITLVHGANTASLLYPLSSLKFHNSKKKQGYENNSIPLIDSKFHYISVTNDGSSGYKGVATDVITDFLNWADQVFACGPTGMYITMLKLIENIQFSNHNTESNKYHQDNIEKLYKCQLSLEVRMGCGIGTCYGCSINTKNGMKKVCLDGPIFELDQILWDEVLI